jgi:hypothetical protein
VANQSQTKPTPDPKQSTMRAITARIKVLRLLSVAAAALFLLVGTIHANILVTNYHTGYVELWSDDGTLINSHFISVGASTEGLQCVKLSSNQIYVANANNNHIGVYYLSGPHAGQLVPGASFDITGGGQMASLATNISGTVLYAADYTMGKIWAVDVPFTGGGGICPPGGCSVIVPGAHDVIVGPDGYVYATHTAGVVRIAPYVRGGPAWNPPSYLPPFIPTGNYGIHHNSLTHPRGMVFDGSGNLWVTNAPATAADGIFEFTGHQNPNPAKFLNFASDPNSRPFGLDVSPVNPPGPLIDTCKGCIVVAEFDGAPPTTGSISQIDPTTDCNVPEICTFKPVNHPYFTIGPSPKYVKFTENCCDSGYVEICKMSCLTNPVHGYFTFTATNAGVSSGPLSIPVNACSGPIPIPNGIVTIIETQQLGIEVTNITAYNYDYLGNQINALLSFNLPFQTGNVDVVSGDVSTETVAGFTNCASGPGELKICKVAGPGVQVGTLFTFTAQGFGLPMRYQVPAGPAPGGYCVVGASYQVGTPVLVTETGPPGYVVSNITVAPPDRGGHQTSNSVVAIIDSGTTEVTFTNTASGGVGCPTCRVH